MTLGEDMQPIRLRQFQSVGMATLSRNFLEKQHSIREFFPEALPTVVLANLY